MTAPSSKYIGENSQYGANCLVHQLDYRHWVWCILNGHGHPVTERVNSGDRDANYGTPIYCIPSRDKMPGIEITPYKGELPNGWGAMATGEAEELLRVLYAAMRVVHPDNFHAKMLELQGWTRKAWRLFVDIGSYGDKMDAEFEEIDKIPVPLGRDGIIAAFRCHVMGKPYYYIEGVSRTVVNSVTKDFLNQMVNYSDLDRLMLIDTGFAGSIPRRLLVTLGIDQNISQGYGGKKVDLVIPYGVNKKYPSIQTAINEINLKIAKSSDSIENYYYLLSSQNYNDDHYCFSTTHYGHYDNQQRKDKYMFEGSQDAYRQTIIEMEYTAKLYLRPVEVIEGFPKLQPSGDAIKAALMNLAIFCYLRKAYPDQEISLYRENPLLYKTVKTQTPESEAMNLETTLEVPDIKTVIEGIKKAKFKPSKKPPVTPNAHFVPDYTNVANQYADYIKKLEHEELKPNLDQVLVAAHNSIVNDSEFDSSVVTESNKVDALFNMFMEGLNK